MAGGPREVEAGDASRGTPVLNTTIMLFLLQDGITNGAIYALLGLALVLVFAVTRVILIPQGEFVTYGALSYAVLATGKVPGTAWLAMAMGVVAFALDLLDARRSLQLKKVLRSLALNIVLPAALLRRLVSKPGIGRERAREEASAVGLALADNYWPAVLSWGPTTPRSDAVERVSREAMRLAGGGQTVAVKEHIVLLHPGDGRPATVMAWLEQVVAHARSAVPSSHPQVVTAEAPVALAEIGARVAQLRRLSGYGPRTEAGGPVVQARHYALERLLDDAVAPADARGFVQDLLGGVVGRGPRPPAKP